jgi:hypothetical protein
MAGITKIKVANPIVDLDGDEMTRWAAGSQAETRGAGRRRARQALSCFFAGAICSQICRRPLAHARAPADAFNPLHARMHSVMGAGSSGR